MDPPEIRDTTKMGAIAADITGIVDQKDRTDPPERLNFGGSYRRTPLRIRNGRWPGGGAQGRGQQGVSTAGEEGAIGQTFDYMC